MPNWIEGKLKIRGDKKDIKRFLEEELEEVIYKNNTTKEKKITIKNFSDGDFVIEKTDLWNRFKFKNTRHYITEEKIYSLDNCKSEEKDVLVVGFEAATIINPIHFEGASIEYDLDFKIYGFEQGGEFNQDIEVVNGKIVKDELIEFDDYVWECIDPTIGG